MRRERSSAECWDVDLNQALDGEKAKASDHVFLQDSNVCQCQGVLEPAEREECETQDDKILT